MKVIRKESLLKSLKGFQYEKFKKPLKNCWNNELTLS